MKTEMYISGANNYPSKKWQEAMQVYKEKASNLSYPSIQYAQA
jgi:hypothetical protein